MNLQQTLEQAVNAQTIAGIHNNTLFMAVTFVCAAQALASRVFPVPGAPYNRTPAQHKQKVTNLTNLVSLSNSMVPSSGKNAMTCIHVA